VLVGPREEPAGTERQAASDAENAAEGDRDDELAGGAGEIAPERRAEEGTGERQHNEIEARHDVAEEQPGDGKRLPGRQQQRGR
jgi:hypothetical protein